MPYPQLYIIRLEGQVKRYKAIADTCEKQEDELKKAERKSQRELRKALNDLEDLRSENTSLQRKLDKLTRSSLAPGSSGSSTGGGSSILRSLRENSQAR
ncbi:unnamed protein product [Protopolystoma xenopodis]|uniref:Uncharacterized protein n=1 Tax=Protopolystoma xenopodis TaxID=117903 RepID=A0A3S5C2V8_9PLAT|nr:unnamed protein product [Protopolystoma xenopodis]